MKKILSSLLLLSVFLTCTSFYFMFSGYDDKYVNIVTVDYKKEKIIMVNMLMDEGRVKAKYFAAKDNNGNSVYERYKHWEKGKNVIVISSGTYLNYMGEPDGLTIDDGVIVNNVLSEKFDALVVVNNTGGISVSSLKEANLTIKCNTENKVFDLRKSWDKTLFCQCAKDQEATVFQTHLLVYKDVLKFGANPLECYNCGAARERRFLAVCKDENNKTVHLIIHLPSASTLYDATKKVFDFLKVYADMKEVTFMVNLDVGAQDVFQMYDKNKTVLNNVQGRLDPSYAHNLLAYYFQ